MTVYLFGVPFPLREARGWDDDSHIAEHRGGPYVMRRRTQHAVPPPGRPEHTAYLNSRKRIR